MPGFGKRAWGLCAATAALVVMGIGAAPVSAAYDSHLDLSYDLEGKPNPLERLDLYTPSGAETDAKLPLVVWVHGGGWIRGDKSNRIPDKARYFTDLGYAFASVNYRLSPDPPDWTDATRIRYPAHPHDVGEAIGWLDRNGGEYGADPREILLIGHSAGAQLVSLVATDPSFVQDFGVEPWQIAGAVSLDTDAFDIAEQATQAGNANRRTIWNAFATPAENAADPVWNQASPINAASGKDAPMLMVTSFNPKRVAANQAMAAALGQDPAGVLSLPYSHEEFNTRLGTPAGAEETEAVTAFFEQALADSKPPRAKLTGTPGKRVKTKGSRAKVKFRFKAKPKANLGRFECRLDGKNWKSCSSPHKAKVKKGRHTFKLRAVTDRGRPGPIAKHKFRVIRR